MEDKLKAIIFSFIILSTCFKTLLFSYFIATVYFAILSVIINIISVIGDVVLLQYLILVTGKNKLQRGWV